jgi:DivIVA domain-containing protein
VTQFLLVVAVALTVGAVVFGITMLVTGEDQGLHPVEPDGRAVPLPLDRPLAEPDLAEVRFDTALRGYRMAQVDAALRRAAYDIGYKDELVKVLQAEVAALREGRMPDAEVLRRAREAALAPVLPAPAPAEPTGPVDPPAPAEPTGPVDPPAPAEPTGPVDPSAPAEPTEPVDPSEPGGSAGQTSGAGDVPAANPSDSTLSGSR